MLRSSVRTAAPALLGALAIVFLVASDTSTQPASTAPHARRIPQAWASSDARYKDTDSVAAGRLADGAVHVYATSKQGDVVHVFDAATGRHLRDLGRSGRGPGEFRHPNGIVAIDAGGAAGGAPRALLAVIDRDNRRVQCFWADGLGLAGSFGEDVLHRPYGGAASYRDGRIDLYVTDTEVTPEKTVHAFRLQIDGDRVAAAHLRAFGEVDGPGRIHEAESIVVDDARDRVLLCDEVVNNVKVYTRDGEFAGLTFGDGLVQGDPEGIVVLDEPGDGLVVLTDQRSAISVWYVFDRATLTLRGAFTGDPTVANTDGICVFPGAFDRFSRGLFVAVDDDEELRAYDLADVLRALEPNGGAATQPARSAGDTPGPT